MALVTEECYVYRNALESGLALSILMNEIFQR